ncbi:hypothetical protein Pelo_18760 [Pelomyxa schiedti]|nr:hypothetical protein Pelo_18760 [Pelomyxa schiedti]
MVVDINETYRRRNLTVLSLTKCGLPSAFKFFESAVALRKSNGERGIFVELRTGRNSNTVYEVKEYAHDGSMRILCRDTNQLSQLSGSLFCITKNRCQMIEIWDCNNTTAPLRVLPARHDGVESRAVAASGFLFHKHGYESVDVTDSTGLYVATFEFDTLCHLFNHHAQCTACPRPTARVGDGVPQSVRGVEPRAPLRVSAPARNRAIVGLVPRPRLRVRLWPAGGFRAGDPFRELLHLRGVADADERDQGSGVARELVPGRYAGPPCSGGPRPAGRHEDGCAQPELLSAGRGDWEAQVAAERGNPQH